MDLNFGGQGGCCRATSNVSSANERLTGQTRAVLPRGLGHRIVDDKEWAAE